MRTLIALLPLLGACEAWSDPPKDATWADDSATSSDCRGGKSEQDSSGIYFTDLMVDGLSQVPTVDLFCASTDGLGIQMDYSVDDVTGALYLQLSDYGGYSASDAEVTSFSFYYDDQSWSASDVYAGTLSIDAAGDSGGVAEGVVSVEATSEDGVNLLLGLIWSQ